jgi:hypothetical protein
VNCGPGGHGLVPSWLNFYGPTESKPAIGLSGSVQLPIRRIDESGPIGCRNSAGELAPALHCGEVSRSGDHGECSTAGYPPLNEGKSIADLITRSNDHEM